MEHACEAKKALTSAVGEEEKEYYQSKVLDFKFFVQQQLVKNVGLAHSMLNFEEDLSQLKV